MYSCISKPETAEDRVNRQIDKDLSHESKKNLSCLKLLLLGTGESGKSTILKQMRIIHIDGFSDAEKLEFIPLIKRNIRDAILAIVVSMNQLNIVPKSFNVSEKVQYFQQAFNVNYSYSDEFFDVVSGLWQDEDVQLCFARSNEFQIIDSAKYFLDKLEVIRQSEYIPTLQDILRCRKMTNAIAEINFQVKRNKHKVNFKVFDVGGQKGERKRWIQLFGDVTAILFIADCSSFDQTLREDRSKNRLLDSLEVFAQAWMNRYLQSVPIIVFINKIDVLDEKIKNDHSISKLIQDIKTFPDPIEYIRRASDFDHVLKGNKKNGEVYSDGPSDIDNESKSGFPYRSSMNSDRKISIKTVPNSRRHSKDSNYDFVTQIISEYSWDAYEPSGPEKIEFIKSFPTEILEGTTSSRKHKSKDSHLKDSHLIHTETIRTACYIRNLFEQIIKKQPKSSDQKCARRRKYLFYYTCAVSTNNIQHVLEACRSFLMEEHLERFGIL